jgi:putative SOS response-associated peptidase YedK
MCGRFVIASSPEAIRHMFGYPHGPNFPARFNVAPTQPIPVIVQEAGARQFHLMRWAFLPAWAKEPAKFGLVINARAETIAEKPAFRNAIRRRRCLIPADGYFEWQTLGARKRPLYIYPAAGGPIAFAGVFETWAGPNGEEVDTVALVTTAASPDLTALHHRMPVTIAPDAFAVWLDCAHDDVEVAMSLLITPPVGTFAWHEVSTAVNRVANDDPRLIEPVSAEDVAAEAAKAKAEAEARKAARARPPRKTVSSDQGSLF